LRRNEPDQEGWRLERPARAAVLARQRAPGTAFDRFGRRDLWLAWDAMRCDAAGAANVGHFITAGSGNSRAWMMLTRSAEPWVGRSDSP
jgi:hypothetical protein